jgi:hypothetical protein
VAICPERPRAPVLVFFCLNLGLILIVARQQKLEGAQDFRGCCGVQFTDAF